VGGISILNAFFGSDVRSYIGTFYFFCYHVSSFAFFLFFGWVVFSMGHWDKAMMMNTQCNLDS
jgi:hypothetical protein